jgi:hypothetical protein
MPMHSWTLETDHPLMRYHIRTVSTSRVENFFASAVNSSSLDPNPTGFWWENLMDRDRLEDLVADTRTIL